jgi:hypothetical protein
MNLLKSKRFRADQKDIFGKQWVSEFAKERASEEVMAKVANPKKGDVIYDPEDPDNLEKVLMYDGDDWIRPINARGEHGGPYLDEREARRNPEYVAHQAAAAAAAAAATGVSVADRVFAEYLAIVPADRRAEAQAAAAPKYAAALEAAAKEAGGADLMQDAIKLGAKARRAFKGYMPADIVFEEHIAKLPEDKRVKARAEGLPKFGAAVLAAAASDPTVQTDMAKLAKIASDILKAFMSKDAAPAAAAKGKKKGGGRSRKARRGSRKGTRKGRRGSRKH